MDLGLSDKVAVVTGGSKGIGLACARVLAAEGARVAIIARDPGQLAAAGADIEAAGGAAPLTVSADLSGADGVAVALDAVIGAHGRVDVVVNNVGSAPHGDILDLTDAQWEQALSLKFLSYVRMSRAVIPHFRAQRSGAIVNVLGNDGVQPAYWKAAGAAANAAGINLTLALAQQIGPYGARVNAVLPGPVRTDRWDELMRGLSADAGATIDETKAVVEHSIPCGRAADPDEIAKVVAFLGSEAASYVHGAVIPLDGAQQKAVISWWKRGWIGSRERG